STVPGASVADVAAGAGVGRGTPDGRCQPRAGRSEGALGDSLERAEDVLSQMPLDGDPRAAFQRLVASSWMFVDQSRALRATAQKELSAARIRELHEKAEARMRGLLLRGQREGAFRADL